MNLPAPPGKSLTISGYSSDIPSKSMMFMSAKDPCFRRPLFWTPKRSAVSDVIRRIPSSRLNFSFSRIQCVKKKVGWLASIICLVWAPASAKPSVTYGRVNISAAASICWFKTGSIKRRLPSSSNASSIHCSGIDTPRFSALLISHPEASTGNAMIGVDAEGNNSIIVNPGANGALAQEDILAAEEIVESSQVVLMQLEIPTRCLEIAVEMANGIIILNPAPVVDISKGLLEKVDVLIPNRIELARLSGKEAFNSLDEVEAAAKSLDIQTVIVTLGSEGALLVSGDQTELVSSPVVESVDTTGAGDAFCGSVAESLSRGLSFLESVEHSVTAGALSTTTYGAQISMPTRSEVDSFSG